MANAFHFFHFGTLIAITIIASVLITLVYVYLRDKQGNTSGIPTDWKHEFPIISADPADRGKPGIRYVDDMDSDSTFMIDHILNVRALGDIDQFMVIMDGLYAQSSIDELQTELRCMGEDGDGLHKAMEYLFGERHADTVVGRLYMSISSELMARNPLFVQ